MPQEFSIGNAAGTCRLPHEVLEFCRSGLTHITVGSVTVGHRSGNEGGENAYRDEAGNSLNSLGMPNQGLGYYHETLPAMVAYAREAGMKLSLSIAPDASGPTSEFLPLCLESGLEVVEINAGCPNVWSPTGQKRILSFDLEGLRDETRPWLEAKRRARRDFEVRIKLSPYSDPEMLREVARFLEPSDVTIVACNTYPNGFSYVWENDIPMPAIGFGEGLGGVSGQGFKNIALGQVRQFRKWLPDHPIIGVGGISSGRDIREYELAGANGIQLGTALYYASNKLAVINGVLVEYADLLSRE